MALVFFWLLIWFNDNLSFEKVYLINRAKEKAELAYWQKDYPEAVKSYEQIVESSVLTEPAARMNLAHSYFQTKQYQKAAAIYSRLAKNSDAQLASSACNQLGVLSCFGADSSAALRYFTKALLNNNNNQQARFNYELIKKRFGGLGHKLPQNNPETQSPQADAVQNKQLEKPQEVATSVQKKDFLKKLRDLKMTQEQAQSLLDALKNSETQYIQQLQRQQKNNSQVVEAGSW